MEQLISQIKICCEWLMNKPSGNTINYDIGSRGLCCLIAKEFKTTISYNAFIAAVMLMKIPHKQSRASDNIYIGIPTKELLTD